MKLLLGLNLDLPFFALARIAAQKNLHTHTHQLFQKVYTNGVSIFMCRALSRKWWSGKSIAFATISNSFEGQIIQTARFHMKKWKKWNDTFEKYSWFLLLQLRVDKVTHFFLPPIEQMLLESLFVDSLKFFFIQFPLNKKQHSHLLAHVAHTVHRWKEKNPNRMHKFVENKRQFNYTYLQLASGAALSSYVYSRVRMDAAKVMELWVSLFERQSSSTSDYIECYVFF